MSEPAQKRTPEQKLEGRSLEEKPQPSEKVEYADAAEIGDRKILKVGRPEAAEDKKTTDSKAGPDPETGKAPVAFKLAQPADYKPLFGSGTFVFDKSKVNEELFGLKKDEAEGQGKAEEPAKRPAGEQPPAGGAGKPGSLFSGLADENKFASIFSTNGTGSLFGGGGKSSGSIFGNVPQGNSIFGNLANVSGRGKGEAGSEEQSDGGEGEDDAKEETDEEATRQKATVHHKYESPFEPVVVKPASNFRVEGDDALGAGFVSIEKLKEGDSQPAKESGAGGKQPEAKGEGEGEGADAKAGAPGRFPVIVFRNKAKNILHTSYLIPKVSVCVYLKNRTDAVAAFVLHTRAGKEGAEAPKPAKTSIKVLFGSEADAGEFLRKFNEASGKEAPRPAAKPDG